MKKEFRKAITFILIMMQLLTPQVLASQMDMNYKIADAIKSDNNEGVVQAVQLIPLEEADYDGLDIGQDELYMDTFKESVEEGYISNQAKDTFREIGLMSVNTLTQDLATGEYIEGFTERQSIAYSSTNGTTKIGSFNRGSFVHGQVTGSWLRTSLNGQTAYMNLNDVSLFETKSLTNKNFVIVLDPGHGPGLKHNRGGLLFNEGDHNYLMSQALIEEAKKYENVEVITTRPTGDEDPSLKTRAEIGSKGDIFISLHSNAYHDSSVRGAETFGGTQNKNLELGKDFNALFAQVLSTPNRGVFYLNQGGSTRYTRPNSTKANAWLVFQGNLAPEKFLVEIGFHTNYADSYAYINKRDLVAKGMMEVLAKHYSLEKKTNYSSKPEAKPNAIFDDLSVGHWAYEHIINLYNKKIVHGYKENDGLYFKPDREALRAESLKIILKQMKMPTPTNITPFYDVDRSYWGAHYVAAAYNAGIVQGFPDGSFRPAGKITRAEFATIIQNAYKFKPGSVKASFNDLRGHWAAKNINILVSQALMEGYTDKSFRPDKNITRAEIAAIMDRLMQKTK